MELLKPLIMGLIVIFAYVLEKWIPIRRIHVPGKSRVKNNLTIAGINFILVKVFIAFIAYWFTFFHPMSLFVWNWQWEWVFWIIFLDFLIYWQHRLFHILPVFWKFHWLHHTDIELNWSSGVRFHTVEIILSLILKLSVVYAFNIPMSVLFIYEFLLTAFSIITHVNVKVPTKIEAIVGKVFITPSIHRIHHSTDLNESNSNFGNIFVFWDWIFKSYRSKPRKKLSELNLGVKDVREELPALKLLSKSFSIKA